MDSSGYRRFGRPIVFACIPGAYVASQYVNFTNSTSRTMDKMMPACSFTQLQGLMMKCAFITRLEVSWFIRSSAEKDLHSNENALRFHTDKVGL